MSVDMVVNILFVLLVGNIFGILAASNLGYVLAHMFALSGLRPPSPRPSELAAPDQAGGDLDADRRDSRRVVPDPDGGRLRLVPERRRRLRRDEGEDHRHRRARVGLLLFFFRRIVQDKERHWRRKRPADAGCGTAAGRCTRRLAATSRRGTRPLPFEVASLRLSP